MTSLRLALAELRTRPTRPLAVVVAVAISVGFMVASVAVVRTEFHATGVAMTRQLAGSDLVVEEYTAPTADVRAALEAVPGVELVEPSYRVGARVEADGRSSTAVVTTVGPDPRLRPADLVEGRWPTGPSEVTVDDAAIEALDTGLGGELVLDAGNGAQPVTVVGRTDAGAGLMGGGSLQLHAAPAWFEAAASAETGAGTYLVLADPGVDPASLVAPLQQATDAVVAEPGTSASVQTTAEAVAASVSSATDGADVLTVLLMVFASIALLVGALIIANTFAILIAQRRRQIGLLRAVGGSTAQLRAGLLAEAALVGLVGAVLGVALGVGVTAAVAAWTGSLATGLQLPVVGVVGPVLAGVLVTVLASLAAIGRATAISPMEALRPVATPAQGRRATVVRVVVCGLLAVVGGGLAAVALHPSVVGLAGEPVLAVAILGAAALSLAVLGAAPLYVPTLVRGVGLLTRVLGPVGRMTTAQMSRNPARTAATCVALMLAVGVTVTLQTGAATTSRTLLGDIEERFPVDFSLTRYDGADVPPETVERLRAVDGVERTLVLPAGQADTGDGYVRTVYAVDPAQADAFLPEPLPALDDRSVVLSPQEGLDAGDEVAVTVLDPADGTEGRTATYTAVISHAAHGGALLTEQAFTDLFGQTNAAGLWLDADPAADAAQVTADVSSVAGSTDYRDAGVYQQATGYTQVLDTLVLIATGLLGAAVLISLVGVGNTLALSVIERTRESALLRALGLQRRQLRLMLLLEALTVAVVSAVVGVLAGGFLGWLGASALMGVLGQEEAELAVSWPQTLGVAAVALVAAALASVLPGRRAATAPPVAALAVE
ncbi:ABC transporter permease [Desertihabitans brevis]|uniref:ABC transporter permease n=1 Tax=Desertihabitans brevis TaxID=2268447 RepID=A0A367YWI7_9ACTN|nr:ABC transporter permease [Desertihabitans brevis]RCK70263.1 ABC transporter permease [Desertihabitans brevis]